jgi:hypothetical protein
MIDRQHLDFQRREPMTEHAMPDSAPNTVDLFEIMRTTRSMRRLKPDPVPNELIRCLGTLACDEAQHKGAFLTVA